MMWFVLGVGAIVTVVGLGLAARRRTLVVTVIGVSMTPTLHPDDRVLVRRRSASQLRTGDVVVLREPVFPRWADGTPGSPAPLIVKRLAAVPGDPFPQWLPAWARPGATVPPDQYVMVGDNPESSDDSRRFGPVTGDRLIGVVLRRVGGGPIAPAPAVVIGPVVYRRGSLPANPASGGD